MRKPCVRRLKNFCRRAHLSGRVVADFGGDFVGGELTQGQKSVIIEPSESGDIDEEMIR